jgi:hypothetical protein
MAKSAKIKPDSRQIFVTLPKGARALFNQLVERKLYGEDNSSVGRHLIMIGLDRLVEQNRLIDLPNPSTDDMPDDSEPPR